jgi:hypothetical protein
LDCYVKSLDVERFEEDLGSLFPILRRVERWFGLDEMVGLLDDSRIITTMIDHSPGGNNGPQAQLANT